MKWITLRWLLIFCVFPASAAEYSAPAGTRPAICRRGLPSILPGGRIIAPAGKQYVTGPGPFGLAISPDHRTLVSVNSGPERFSITVLERDKKGATTTQHFVAVTPQGKEGREDEAQWRSVFMGAAFSGNHAAYISEGNSGRVRLIDLGSGNRRKLYNLNQKKFSDSYTGDLAFDAERELLYVLDQANFRLVTIDTRKGQIVASLPVGRLPFAIALAPDKRTAYITNIGMFQYSPVPGADRKHPQGDGTYRSRPSAFPSPDAMHRSPARHGTRSGGRAGSGRSERTRIEFALYREFGRSRRAPGGECHPHGKTVRRGSGRGAAAHAPYSPRATVCLSPTSTTTR